MNQKADQKQKSHEAIIASAAALLRGRGIRASSVADVMQGAGLTVGGFYGHFSSKEQLFAETIRSSAGVTWRELFRSAQGETPRARVRSAVRRYLSRRHRDQPDTGCMLPSVAPEVAREGGPYRPVLEHKLREFAGSLAALLGPGRESRELSLGLVALMYGALSLSRAVAGTPLSDELLKAGRALAERMLEAEPP